MLRNLIQSFFTKGSVAVINFLILILSAKYLGIATRGEISLVILNLSIIQMINEIYTGYSLVHFVSKFNVKAIYKNGVVFTLIVSGLTNLILLLLNKTPENFGGLLFFLALIIILNTFNCVLILAKEFYKMYNFLSILQPVVLLMGILFSTLVLRNYTLGAYLWPMIISFIISFAISSIFVFNYVFAKNTNTTFEYAPILKNGFYCQLAVLMYILSGKLSYYLLETKPDVGLYSTSMSLIESVLIITNSFAPVLLAKVANQTMNISAARLTLLFAKLCFIFSVLAITIIYFIPETLFSLVLGESFSASKNLMLLISPGIALLSFSGTLSNYFSGIGNLKMVSFYNFFGFLCTIIIAPFLINSMGINGAAISTNVAYLITFLVSLTVFMKINKLPFISLFRIKEDYEDLKQLISSK